MNSILFEIKQLKAFAAVAELGSFSLAANELNQTQSATSQLIQALEQSLNCQLLDRKKRPVQMTLAGQEFYLKATEILKKSRELQENMFAIRKGKISKIKVGMVDSILALAGIELLEYLTDKVEQISQTTGTAPELTKALETGKLDIIISVVSLDLPQEVDIYPIQSESFVLVTPKAWPEMSLQELCNKKRFIQYESWTTTGSQTHQWLRWRKLKINSIFSVSRAETVLELVAKDFGWSFATPSFLALRPALFNKLSVYPLPAPGINRDIAVLGKRGEMTSLLSSLACDIKEQVIPSKLTGVYERWQFLK